jgi:hypothetical protein
LVKISSRAFAHPGGNSSGVAIFEFSMGGQQLERLKAIAPNVKGRFAYLQSRYGRVRRVILQLAANRRTHVVR